jgi:hypothetical protein
MGNLTSLEELRLGRVHKFKKFGKDLSKLTELRVLCIHTRHILRGNMQSLSKLQKIEVLEISMGEGMLVQLMNYFRRRWSSQKPWPQVIPPGAFPKLRYMKMNSWLMSQPGAMPRLKSVELHVHVRVLKDANFDFHDFYKLSYLRLLEKAHVGINCRDAMIEEAEEAEAALRHAVQSHPNRPTLILTRLGQCVDDNQVLLLVFSFLFCELVYSILSLSFTPMHDIYVVIACRYALSAGYTVLEWHHKSCHWNY